MSASFQQSVRRALSNPVLQEALDNNAARRKAGARRANATLDDPVAVRQHARAIRQTVLDNWDPMLTTFIESCQANGIVVLQAASAEQACAHVLDIARRHNVRLVAKAKSMVSEEIHLNPYLERAGLKVVETDLGEFIVQLRGEPPAHIITPALHLRRQEVGRTFADHLGMPYTDDVSAMTAVARRTLRQIFLTADMGISGVNLAAADTGTLCLVTNEGNGRMVTTLPPVHVALMGIERLVPTIEDLALILQLLPRNATGQILTSYVTLIQGPGSLSIADGSQHRYLILIDNGRRAMHGTPLDEALMCIRCGACLNNCPVFQELGGHAYGSAYPGPIGSVVSPGLFGIAAFGHLAKASTLCGACKEACPIGIDIPRMLLQVRHEYVCRRWRPAGPALGAAALRLGRHPSVALRLRAAPGGPGDLAARPGPELAALASAARECLDGVKAFPADCGAGAPPALAADQRTGRRDDDRPPGGPHRGRLIAARSRSVTAPARSGGHVHPGTDGRLRRGPCGRS